MVKIVKFQRNAEEREAGKRWLAHICRSMVRGKTGVKLQRDDQEGQPQFHNHVLLVVSPQPPIADECR